MMLYMYLDERRTLKYWRKVVFSIIGRMVVNSYILYYQHTSDRKKMSRHKFTIQLVEQLSKELLDTKYPPQDDQQGPKYETIPNNKEKDCSVCSDRSKKDGRKRTRTMCKNCQKDVHHYCMPKHTCKKAKAQ